MKQKMLLGGVLMLLSATWQFLNAQISIGMTGGVGIPQGAFGGTSVLLGTPNYYLATPTAKTGYGGAILGRYHFKHIGAGLNASYLLFDGKNIPFSKDGYPDGTGDFNNFSICGALDYYPLTGAFRPFISVEMGFIWTLSHYIEPAGPNNGAQDAMSTGRGFCFAPGIGLTYEMTDHLGITCIVKYMIGMNESAATDLELGVPTTTYLGVNAGIQYKFGK